MTNYSLYNYPTKTKGLTLFARSISPNLSKNSFSTKNVSLFRLQTYRVLTFWVFRYSHKSTFHNSNEYPIQKVYQCLA